MLIALIGHEANIKNRVGSNQYAFELIKAIYGLDKENQYIVYLPTPPLPDLPKERKNWQYKIVGPSKLWNIFGLPWVLYQQRPKLDIVFNPGHYSPLFFPAPLIVSVMDLGYLRFPKQFTKAILFKLKFWTLLSIKRASHIFAISQSTKNDIIKYYRTDPAKITVTYPGCKNIKYQISNIKNTIQNLKRKYKISGEYILFLGALKPNKNVEGLLEAFKIVQSANSKVQNLVIAGRKGWLCQGIFEKVKQLGLEDEVVFTDFVKEDEVPLLMAGAKVFVLPSFWEGFGVPVVEAMACGTPVVVSNAGSLPEVVGNAGVVVDPYDVKDIARGMRIAMENREELIKKGFKQSQKFSWEKCARETLKVLEEVGRK